MPPAEGASPLCKRIGRSAVATTGRDQYDSLTGTLMSFIAGISNLLALFYLLRAGQLAVQIGRNWAAVRAEPLTHEKQRLAEQAAFFISVPPAVLVHELFHALAVWLFGGQVVEFAYRVFWGYVVPAGTFTPAQLWFIGLSGTLGSLLFGLGIWLALRHNPSRTLRYFGLRSFRFQIFFSLLYYPLITLILPIGDWRIIYDFAATPILSGATLVAHVGLLFAFWRADRHGRFEMPAFRSEAAQAHYLQAEAQAAAGDPSAILTVIDSLRVGGAPHQAQRRLDGFLADHPTSADGLLLRAMLGGGGRRPNSQGAADLRQALAAGLSGERAVYAHELLARYYLERNEWAAAAAEAGAALATGPAPLEAASLLILRSQALRHQGHLPEAAAAAEEALKLALTSGDTLLVGQAAEQLEIAAKQGGTPLPPWVVQLSEPTGSD